MLHKSKYCMSKVNHDLALVTVESFLPENLGGGRIRLFTSCGRTLLMGVGALLAPGPVLMVSMEATVASQ